jgi:circadian clock protein KaiC
LDEILRGGLPRDTMLLVEGEPGTGKTTLALQFLLAGARRGETGLFVSLSQTEAELRMIAESHGFDLDGIEIFTPDISAAADERSVSVVTDESDLAGTMAGIYERIETQAPDLFVFDSLLEVRLLAPDEMAYRREVLALRRRLADRKVTTLVVDHRDRPNIDRQIEGIVHGAISLESEAPPIGITHRRLYVTKMRGCAFREGFHDCRILTGGLVVYPRIVPTEHEPAQLHPQLATGQAPLDRMLGGGLEFGTTTLIVGQAGTGKSTLATLLALAAGRRETDTRAAMFLFEERPEVFRERSQGVGLPMRGAEDDGRLLVRHFDPAEISPGEISQTVVDAIENKGVRVVVIDSLSGYLNALPDRENVLTHLHALLQYLARRGVLVIVTMAQHGLLGEPPRSDLDTSYLADSILLLRHYAAGSEIRRSLAVLKKRHSAHERKIQEFAIAPGTVEVLELSDEAAARTGHSGLVGGP